MFNPLRQHHFREVAANSLAHSFELLDLYRTANAELALVQPQALALLAIVGNSGTYTRRVGLAGTHADGVAHHTMLYDATDEKCMALYREKQRKQQRR